MLELGAGLVVSRAWRLKLVLLLLLLLLRSNLLLLLHLLRVGVVHLALTITASRTLSPRLNLSL